MSDEGGVIASIPIGALTQNPFLAGVGPKIKLKYETISAITCSVEKDVKSYGVNHVMVSLKLVIKIKMMVLLPFYNEEFNKDYDYPLVMEIIEGRCLIGIRIRNFTTFYQILSRTRKLISLVSR